MTWRPGRRRGGRGGWRRRGPAAVCGRGGGRCGATAGVVGLDYVRLAGGQSRRGRGQPWGMTLLVELLARDAAEHGSADLDRIAGRVGVLRADALVPGHGLPADVAAAVM